MSYLFLLTLLSHARLVNTELFIARKLFKSNEQKANQISRPVVKIAILAIALSLTVMIIAVSVLTGFQLQIMDKVIGFGSHIQITNFDSNTSLEPSPINKNQSFLPELEKNKDVKHIQVFATKAGIIKTKEDIEGIVLKGVGRDFDWSFFDKKITKGEHFTVTDTGKSNKILISQHLASKLKLKVNDNVLMYFIQKPPRVRKFNISGIYETGFEEFDSKYVLADIGHIQKLNDWDSSQVGGFEVYIKDFNELQKTGEQIYSTIGYDLNAKTIKEIYPQIFDWLNLTNMNVQVILILMIIVGVINMTTALLIMILERTNMIGILKALGANNWTIRKVFLYNATFLITRGLFIGNIIGISLCLLQKHFGLIQLDQESYYVSVVPVDINWLYIFLLNLGTLIICLFVLLIPSYVVSKITPVKAIRFR